MKATLLCLLALALVCFSACATVPTDGENKDSVCDLCEYFVFELEGMVNKSKPEIEKKLVKMCESLKQEYRSMCDTMVLLYGPKIIDYILAKEDPKKLCTQFKLCPVKVVVPEEKVGGVQCQLCTYVVNIAEQHLINNKTVEEIEGELHKVCSSLPATYGKICDSVVDQYVPYIVYYLKQKYPAEKICELLKLCEAMQQKVEGSEVECFMCSKLVEYAEQYLASNKTEHEIETLLDKVCNEAPFGMKDYCKALVAQYLPYMIHFLEQKYPPKKVCQMMNICPAAVSCSNGLEPCPTCKIVIEALEKLLGQVISRSQIEKALEQVCTKVDAKFQPACKTIIDNFAFPIVETIIQHATPDTVCRVIRQC